jgi:hypothetical protein
MGGWLSENCQHREKLSESGFMGLMDYWIEKLSVFGFMGFEDYWIKKLSESGKIV